MATRVRLIGLNLIDEGVRAHTWKANVAEDIIRVSFTLQYNIVQKAHWQQPTAWILGFNKAVFTAWVSFHWFTETPVADRSSNFCQKNAHPAQRNKEQKHWKHTGMLSSLIILMLQGNKVSNTFWIYHQPFLCNTWTWFTRSNNKQPDVATWTAKVGNPTLITMYCMFAHLEEYSKVGEEPGEMGFNHESSFFSSSN